MKWLSAALLPARVIMQVVPSARLITRLYPAIMLNTPLLIAHPGTSSGTIAPGVVCVSVCDPLGSDLMIGHHLKY